MAIAIGNTASNGGKTVSLDNNKTSGENAVVLNCFVYTIGSSITSVTYGGVAMTKASEYKPGGTNMEHSIWYLVDAPSGINTASASTTTSASYVGTAGIVLNGVDESDPLGSTFAYDPAAATNTKTSSTSLGSMMIDCTHGETFANPAAGQTQWASYTTAGLGGRVVNSSYKPAISTSTSMGWTRTNATFSYHVGAEFKAKASAQKLNNIIFFT